jgi:hypothetical protein
MVSGAPQGRNHTFETLKLMLASKCGRESLYVLPIERATEAINILEQVSAKQLLVP